MAKPREIKRVTEKELREMFNQGGYLEKVARGELVAKVIADNHPSRPLAREPFCTRSQIIAYCEPSGKHIVKVHQYLRTDGSIGASGRPDPKRLRQGDIVFVPKARP